MQGGRVRKVSTLGLISTVAGSGVTGFSGDGGPATAARIQPWYGAEVAVDDAGNLYLADSYNDRIRKVDPLGTITSVGAGQVDFPTGLALDGSGNLFVASALDNKVRKMTPGGAWSTVAGNGTHGFGGEGGPATSAELALIGFGMGGDVAVDHHGTLFIGGFQRIWKVDGVATPVTFPAQPATTTTSTTTSTTTTSTSTSTTTTTTVPGRTSAWGLNHAGQAGLGPSGGSARAAPVTGAAVGQTAAAAGWYHSLAVNPPARCRRGDGTITARSETARRRCERRPWRSAASPASPPCRPVWPTAWPSSPTGRCGHGALNMFGQLGDGTTTDRRTPQKVPGPSGVVAVAAGAYHSLALKADGTVWAWGWNGAGSLGDGTTTHRSVPVPVTLPAVSSIAAGGFHSMAVMTDGTVRAWGWNNLGQLGTGTTTESSTPLVVRVPP